MKPTDPTDLVAQVQELRRQVEALASRTGARSFTTADRPAASSMPGAIIFNLTTLKHEGSNGASWNALY